VKRQRMGILLWLADPLALAPRQHRASAKDQHQHASTIDQRQDQHQHASTINQRQGAASAPLRRDQHQEEKARQRQYNRPAPGPASAPLRRDQHQED